MTGWWQQPCVSGSRIGEKGYAYADSGQKVYAHRSAWEAVYGPIPDGYHVHHVCGNKACINVAHLRCLPPGEHYRQHRTTCGHDPGDRWVSPNGRHSYCRPCRNNRKSKREKERYANDPEYREAVLAYNREQWLKRKGVMPNA